MKRERNDSKSLTRREVLKCGLYGGLAAGLSGSLWLSGCKKTQQQSGPTTPRAKKPNVVLIVVDTLRADHCGCYGYDRNTTPNIDGLARDALLFRRAISAAPWTLPAVASLLTSQYPTVLGIQQTAATVDPRFPFLPAILRQHGYATHGVVSHTLLGPQMGLARGFDSYDWASGKRASERATSPEVTAKATDFLSRKHDKPFFLFLHYFDPHANFLSHEGHDFRPAAYRGPLASNHPLKELWRIRHKLTADDLKYLLSLYDSEISFTDAHIGRVLDTLKQRGLYDDSVVVLTADHGEEFMERDWIGHFTTLHQELLHVPLIMKIPDAKARSIESPVAMVDVMPTLLQRLGVESPGSLEGKALAVDSGSVAVRPIFSETFTDVRQRFAREEGLPPEEPIELKSILLGDRKLIYDERTEARRVYDLAKDPREQTDLSSQRRDEDRPLARLLSQWMDYVSKKKHKGAQVGETELFTPEQIEELKSMGYL